MFVIMIEDIIIDRLKSVVLSNVRFPADHEDCLLWAYQIFLLHKDDLIGEDYLKKESIK